MNKQITPEDLILFAYNESGEEASVEIRQALALNIEFQSEYRSIHEMKETLDFFYTHPPQEIVNKILDFAKSPDIDRLHPTGVSNGFSEN